MPWRVMLKKLKIMFFWLFSALMAKLCLQAIDEKEEILSQSAELDEEE